MHETEPPLAVQLLLTKLRPGPLLLEDIPKNVSISSVSHSRISSLYHALKTVYTPLLGDHAGNNHSEADNQLQGLVMQLEAGLGSSLRQGHQVTCLCRSLRASLRSLCANTYCCF